LKKRAAISVIVPVANEAAALPECLARIGGVPNEIIIVDAESDDTTAATARQFGCRLLSFPEGHRARQMKSAQRGRWRVRATLSLAFAHARGDEPAGGSSQPTLRLASWRPGAFR
jgi:glycosyltransferase involved in cell wall biosynthesis